MNKKYIFLIFLVMLLSRLFSQSGSFISYDEYMKLLKNKLPEIEINANKVKLSENELKKTYSHYDVEFTSSASGTGKKIYPDGDITEIDYSTGFIIDGYFNFILPSGTRIKLGAEYAQIYSRGNYSDINYNTFQITDNYFLATTMDPVIKLKIFQPLLYNWFGFIDRYLQNDAKNKLEIEKIKNKENDKIILNIYSKKYFKWIELLTTLKFLEITIENSKQLEKQIQDKINSGLAENDELQRIKYLVLKYQEQYRQTIIQLDELKGELSIFFETSKYQPEIENFNEYYDKSIDTDMSFIDFTMTNSSFILNETKKNLEYIKKVKFNQKLPQLDLFGDLGVKFHDFNKEPRLNSNFDSENKKYFGNIDFVAGIMFSYYFGNIKSKANYNEINLAIKEIDLNFQKSKNEYDSGLFRIINTVKNLKNIMEIKKSSLITLNSQYKTEKFKYNQARIDLRTLLETDNMIAQEEIELIKIKYLLISLFFDYMSLTQ